MSYAFYWLSDLWPSSLSAASFLLKKYHGGYVVIRLALAGHKQANRPFYRIVAAYNKRARDGKYIEQLGTYDPLPNVYNEKLVSFNFDRIKYWIGCGAHPTKPVAKLLGEYWRPWILSCVIKFVFYRRIIFQPKYRDWDMGGACYLKRWPWRFGYQSLINKQHYQCYVWSVLSPISVSLLTG